MIARHIKIAAAFTALLFVGCVLHQLFRCFTFYEAFVTPPNASLQGFLTFLHLHSEAFRSVRFELLVAAAGISLSALVFFRRSWRAALGLSMSAFLLFCIPLFGFPRAYLGFFVKYIFLLASVVFWVLASFQLRSKVQKTGEAPEHKIAGLLFTFRGRISRSEFWLTGVLPLVIVTGIAYWLLFDIFDAAHRAGPRAVGFFLAVASLWPSLALSIKRLHDRDRSGWFLLPALIPFVGIVFCLWLLVETWFLRGTVGPNRFGGDPLEPPSARPQTAPVEQGVYG